MKRITRFNEWLAVKLTDGVGTMWCAYVFALLAFAALPSAIHAGVLAIVEWISQTFIQLVMLSVIMLGQSIQSRSTEKRDQETHDNVMAELALLRELVHTHPENPKSEIR